MKLGLRMVLACSAWLLLSAPQVDAQTCPPDDGSLRPGEPTTVVGTIRNHNGLRGWVGLQLLHSVCGQKEFQLTFIHGDRSATYRATAALNGCNAHVAGRIGYSPTAYYSTEMFIEDGKVEPDASCHPTLEKPDLSKTAVPPDLQNYKATVVLDFANGSRPMRGAVSRVDGKTDALTPWEAYIDPWLNGSEDLLWVKCRDGFRLKDAYTEIAGKRARPDDWLDKETPGLSAPDEPGPSSITITCVKAAPATKAP